MLRIITCGPVSTHLSAGFGFVANGSVLLASDPPINMYPKPILPFGGSLCAIHAAAQSMPFLSTHIGSTPGDGLSGMHVQPFVPFRSVRICILSSIVTMVASFAMDCGAADIALLIMAASVVGGATGPTPGAGFAGADGGFC